MKTTVYRTVIVDDEPRQGIAAIVTLDVMGRVRVDEYGNGRYIEDILSQVIHLPGGEVVTKDDGAEFLKALPFAYSGSRVRAVFSED